MTLGVGLDLMEVDRFERALERRPQLAERLFSDRELEYARARARPGQHLAARFCAKEAAAKALRLERWAFREVEVVATAAGPELRLTGAAERRARELGVGVHLSLTHSQGMAGAVAIASS